MTVELKCLSGYLVDHKQSISTSCGSLPYKSVVSIFDTQEPYGQGKSKKQDCLDDLSTCTKLYENDTYDSSITRVCWQFLLDICVQKFGNNVYAALHFGSIVN